MATRGELTEAVVLAEFVKRGFQVFMPWDPSSPFDLLVSADGERFVRVQCKSGRERNGCILFNCRSTDHGNGPGDYLGRADVFAVYCPSQDEVYVLPVEDAARRGTQLRLRPARNNQRQRVRMAEDHTLMRWAASYAAAAA